MLKVKGAALCGKVPVEPLEALVKEAGLQVGVPFVSSLIRLEIRPCVTLSTFPEADPDEPDADVDGVFSSYVMVKPTLAGLRSGWSC